MNLSKLNVCPGSLAEGFNSYSPNVLRKVFDGKKVSHILPYDSPKKNEDTQELFLSNRERISISGVQEKLSLIQVKNKLRLTEPGEQGTHLLKPIPTDLKKVNEVPANEHLTMQIASQVYDIDTAANALIFFQDGEPAYITKRFDVKKEGGKWGKEDFASLAGKSSQTGNPNYKYDFDYLQLGKLIQQYIPAWQVEIEKYFALVVFNFLFSNGDAHLKNFAVLESKAGDYLLSPAYDLINTRLHVGDSNFALSGGLFPKELRSRQYIKTGDPTKKDFESFAEAIGVHENRIQKIMTPFLERQDLVEHLISNSFLSESSKKGYLIAYNTRLKLLSN